MVNKIKIINVGGTFNKKYSLIDGELVVPQDNITVESILDSVYKGNMKPTVDGIIFKDSLQMTKKDRVNLVNEVNRSKEKKIVIVHGTDTMDKSAKALAKKITDKQIVFVGAMQPYSIDSVEATGTLMMALGYLKANKKDGVFICMNGLIKNHKKIKKNYDKGVFECH